MGEKSGGSYSDQFPNRRLGKVPPPMPEVEPRISPPRSGGRHGRPCRRWSQALVPHEVGEGTVAHAGGGAKNEPRTKWGQARSPMREGEPRISPPRSGGRYRRRRRG